jgi:hypothetical protein
MPCKAVEVPHHVMMAVHLAERGALYLGQLRTCASSMRFVVDVFFSAYFDMNRS